MTERSPLLRPPAADAAQGPSPSPSTEAETTSRGFRSRPRLQHAKSDAILAAQGHEVEMERSFSLWAALGLGFSITNSWVGYLSIFGQNLAYAGPSSVVFGMVVAVCVQWVISLGMYEIAACFPSSGGQYHFVFILAPERYKKFAAFAVGWMNLLGWSVALCAAISVVVASISGLVVYWQPGFEFTQAQNYCVYLLVALASVSPLFLAPRAIPRLLQACLIFSVIGFIIVLIFVLSFRRQIQPWSTVFDVHGTSGWNPRVAWILGVSNSMYAFTSTDAAIHIAEEMIFPERRLPQVLNMTLAMGIGTAFPLLLAMMLRVTDMTAVANADVPYVEAFRQIIHNDVATTIMMVWITLILFLAIIGQWVTVGRLAWAFARDGGLPFSQFFAQINVRLGFPIRTTVTALLFSCLYGLLYLISTTAFNSIVTSAVLFSNITYAAPQLLVVLRGRKNVLPKHPHDLSWFGRLCNVLSPLFVVIIGVLICFPPELPVTKDNINYTPAIIVGFCLAIVAAWYMIGRNFRGPKIDWEILKDTKFM